MPYEFLFCARGCGRIVAAAGRSCPPVDPKAKALACWPKPRGEVEVKAEMARLKKQVKDEPNVFEAEVNANAWTEYQERRARCAP